MPTLYETNTTDSMNVHSTDSCDYSTSQPDYTSMRRPPAFIRITGTVIDGNTVYAPSHSQNAAYYEIILETEEHRKVHLKISSNTYCIDCGEITNGSKLVAFCRPLLKLAEVALPTFDVVVLGFDRDNRMIAADFFDCYLTSQDASLQLTISNNTYVVDHSGRPYCGSLSNQYLVVLYSESTRSRPAQTIPNVVILLS